MPKIALIFPYFRTNAPLQGAQIERRNLMTTGYIFLYIFCITDDSFLDIAKHPQSKLYPSELVTIGILFCLKGSYFRAFYRWLKRDYCDWFGQGHLPERTGLQRLLKAYQYPSES